VEHELLGIIDMVTGPQDCIVSLVSYSSLSSPLNFLSDELSRWKRAPDTT
jgi:hypothetical protein